MGYEIAVCANHGLKGTTIEAEGVRIYPAGSEQYSSDVIAAYADDWGADIVMSLYDVWPLTFAQVDGWRWPWIPWVPIDHDEVTPSVNASLEYAADVIAFSRHGQKALDRQGIASEYIPHGIDTDLFAPLENENDQADLRAEFGFSKGKFLVGMIAANNYYPSRKAIPQVLVAFRDFLDRVDGDAALYLHMVADESKLGVDVLAICESLGLEYGSEVFAADSYGYHLGYSQANLVKLYQCFDVLANPSMGEGFGIPIIEAMACGTPVIATQGTSMTELVLGCGLLVSGDPWWSPQGAFQKIPHTHKITQAMQKLYIEKNETSAKWRNRRGRCCLRALGYDFKDIVAPMFDEYLKRKWAEIDVTAEKG
jgi:glycosyltransferase involved in cell wall biosynthesis